MAVYMTNVWAWRKNDRPNNTCPNPNWAVIMAHSAKVLLTPRYSLSSLSPSTPIFDARFSPFIPGLISNLTLQISIQSDELSMKKTQDRSLDSEIESEEEDGVEESQQEQQSPQRQDQELCLLQFMDSTDDYLSLLDALSTTLRKGWFELASARHSMGTSRISTALLDLKVHSAATSLRVDERDDGSIGMQPFINLRKWTSSEGGECLGEEKYNDKLQRESDSPQLRQRNVSDLSGTKGTITDTFNVWNSSFPEASISSTFI
ncbi:coiled-coil domain-containing protein 115-like isoform X2 [Cucumis melo var. makuwa]|uniref:Vacuolar ATPase assembly protein VMA22 n=1 Tax=Cucumis melo var. makuwa TaxID=1194695 RepID=A0A5A7V950_CUCMM|nr:coiled-coil domain-containing protein 115-like isoform X2 [Cucumis melo var. makuwa]